MLFWHRFWFWPYSATCAWYRLGHTGVLWITTASRVTSVLSHTSLSHTHKSVMTDFFLTITVEFLASSSYTGSPQWRSYDASNFFGCAGAIRGKWGITERTFCTFAGLSAQEMGVNFGSTQPHCQMWSLFYSHDASRMKWLWSDPASFWFWICIFEANLCLIKLVSRFFHFRMNQSGRTSNQTEWPFTHADQHMSNAFAVSEPL